ncbi:MAG: hypothetical protein AAF317_05070, partial [Pseudomonadota bacterium]
PMSSLARETNLSSVPILQFEQREVDLGDVAKGETREMVFRRQWHEIFDTSTFAISDNLAHSKQRAGAGPKDQVMSPIAPRTLKRCFRLLMRCRIFRPLTFPAFIWKSAPVSTSA